MKGLLAISVLLLSVLSLLGLAATDKLYETGRIVNVEKKSHERILYYLVNTPVTQDDPYFEVSLQLNNFVYQCEYTPRHAADSLPDDWLPGTEVKMKLADKRHVSVKGPGGFELQLIIVKRTLGTVETAAPKPASVQN
jgi:hypothetical protein